MLLLLFWLLLPRWLLPQLLLRSLAPSPALAVALAFAPALALPPALAFALLLLMLPLLLLCSCSNSCFYCALRVFGASNPPPQFRIGFKGQGRFRKDSPQCVSL